MMQNAHPSSHQRVLPTWMSMLYLPAHTAHANAFPLGCRPDAVVLDLEDFVPSAEKTYARSRLAELAQGFAAQGIDVLVRINRPLDEAVADLQQAVRAEVRGLLVTKAASAQHLLLLDEFVSLLERRAGLPEGQICFIPLVETAAALTQMDDIAAATSRNVAIALGGEDLAREARMRAGRDTLAYGKARLVSAAAAAGILPCGYLGSVLDFQGADDFRDLIDASRDFGFRLTTCMRPEQVEIVNIGYAPRANELAWAQAVPADAGIQDRAEAGWVMARARRCCARPKTLIDGEAA
ncbi:HpcH/HpaI aldolase/citrate lyase family protein [Diaphorobacter caeni]|uniref:HpcH/HpaI aldolase/citrate lyase family protein n=1 Tax=Diaphorobacter caeni TaxID=2784387 RepID=UPI001890AA9A|nr:aldolase/citrate lyase family protein [Diaphorobacter caeni]MBF5007102.1 CoA ester lyase [Diaphorobacter caeni]